MNWMEFVIQLLDKLAWPLLALLALLTLRQPLAELVSQAKRLKYKDLELEFDQDLQAVSKEAEAAFPELSADKRSRLLSTVKHLPNTAIIEAWDMLDQAAERLIRQQVEGADLNVPTRYKTMGSILAQNDLLDTKKLKLFTELRQLRNKVAHARGFSVGQAEAVLYIELCCRLTEYLNSQHDPQLAAA